MLSNIFYIMIGLNVFCLVMTVIMLWLINKQNYLNSLRLTELQNILDHVWKQTSYIYVRKLQEDGQDEL